MITRAVGAPESGLLRGLVVMALVLVGGGGCVFDTVGLRSGDAGRNDNVSPQWDALVTDGEVVGPDAEHDAAAPQCLGDEMECLQDGGAQVCVNGAWITVGPCLLGCDLAVRECRVPSNVPADLADDGTGALILDSADSPVTIFVDTGEILGNMGTIRPPDVIGLDASSGIYYEQLGQGQDNPGLGVFSMQALHVGEFVHVNVVGQRAIVLLVWGAATIDGTVDVSGRGQVPGPGGFGGGNPGEVGLGACAGQPGGGEAGGHGCMSGSGGGGHAGAGGAGGDSTCGAPAVGGPGGTGGCGLVELVPLVGGSGGAGGVMIPQRPAPAPAHSPAPGGGGGGAIQISAGAGITVGATGGINAGGAGGGQCLSSGGAGAGAGGAILLEGPQVTVAVGGVVAANGGGGGGADCT